MFFGEELAMTRFGFGLRVCVAAALLATVAACNDSEDVTLPTTPATEFTPLSIDLSFVGRYAGGGAGASEIPAYDPASRRLFVVNGALGSVDVVDLSNPAAPSRINQISFANAGGGAANSVAVRNGIVAVAVEATVRTDPGFVVFYRASDLSQLSRVTVGALPDMLIFTPDGSRVLVANEGEPNDAYTVDPEGSISILDVTNISAPTVRSADFRAYNSRAGELRAAGVRIFGPNASVAQDLEPEYIAISDDGATAWVTLQENNAVAIVNIATATVTDIKPLGFKDHRLTRNALDVSDRDNAVNIRNWPIFGMYLPDAIASYRVNGQTYLITANEGDQREYTGFNETVRVSTLRLDSSIFTDAVCGGPCIAPERLGRLQVTSTLGNGPNGYTALYAFGGRSFSIWDAQMNQVWDSGDDFEQSTRALPNALFNASNSNNTLDSRSPSKGPEPEGVVVQRFGQKQFAFIGLERIGGVMIYDVTNPTAPFFVSYLNTRSGVNGDNGPEGLAVITARDSPNGRPLLVVGNETSGTTAIFEINLR
jgi:hypothetical protein